ncbi:hypothetical protein G419_02560 [Rhodococcus triatomae BKS 15-14]|nr:hypothetical protein G419_02560 [Rhodococcus triatomae BKS 15-14]
MPVMKASIVISLAGAAVLALAGCSSDDSSAAPTEDSLRATLDTQYGRLQKGQYAEDYDTLSQRCQDKFTREDYAEAASLAYAGRDFSGPQELAITMDGDSATVIATSFDGKGNKSPMTWRFVEGEWKFDNC